MCYRTSSGTFHGLLLRHENMSGNQLADYLRASKEYQPIIVQVIFLLNRCFCENRKGYEIPLGLDRALALLCVQTSNEFVNFISYNGVASRNTLGDEATL